MSDVKDLTTPQTCNCSEMSNTSLTNSGHLPVLASPIIYNMLLIFLNLIGL